jgi:putative MATE family efflux protein
MLARRLGEKNLAGAEDLAVKGLGYGVVLSVLIGTSLWFLTPTLFQLMGTDPEVTDQGTKYLRVILLGCPFIFLSFILQRIFQAAGDTVTPMWLMFLTLMINTLLDPVLMLGMFGLPRMGVAGAALATVIARLAMVLWGLWLLFERKRIGTTRISHPLFRYIPHMIPVTTAGHLGLRLAGSYRWDWRLFGATLRIGLPAAVTQTLFPFVYMIITRLPASYGPQYVAALRIGHAVEGISFFLALGFAMATVPCVGQNLGAGKPARAAGSAWIASGIVSAILFAFSVFFYIFSRQIGGVFSPEAGTMEASAAYLRILSFSQLFMGLEIVLGGAFSGAGDTVPPMALFVPINLARIPLAYLLSGFAGLGIEGVWWAISGTSILKGVLIALWFNRGRWQTKRV